MRKHGDISENVPRTEAIKQDIETTESGTESANLYRGPRHQHNPILAGGGDQVNLFRKSQAGNTTSEMDKILKGTQFHNATMSGTQSNKQFLSQSFEVNLEGIENAIGIQHMNTREAEIMSIPKHQLQSSLIGRLQQQLSKVNTKLNAIHINVDSSKDTLLEISHQELDDYKCRNAYKQAEEGGNKREKYNPQVEKSPADGIIIKHKHMNKDLSRSQMPNIAKIFKEEERQKVQNEVNPRLSKNVSANSLSNILFSSQSNLQNSPLIRDRSGAAHNKYRHIQRDSSNKNNMKKEEKFVLEPLKELLKTSGMHKQKASNIISSKHEASKLDTASQSFQVNPYNTASMPVRHPQNKRNVTQQVVVQMHKQQTKTYNDGSFMNAPALTSLSQASHTKEYTADQSIFHGGLNIRPIEIGKNKRKTSNHAQVRLASINNQTQQLAVAPLNQSNTKKQAHQQQNNKRMLKPMKPQAAQAIVSGNLNTILGIQEISIHNANPLIRLESPSTFNMAGRLRSCNNQLSSQAATGNHQQQTDPGAGQAPSDSQTERVNNSMTLNRLVKDTLNNNNEVQPTQGADLEGAFISAKKNYSNLSASKPQASLEIQKKNPFTNAGRQSVMDQQSMTQSSLMPVPSDDVYSKQYAQNAEISTGAQNPYEKYGGVFRRRSSINEVGSSQRSYSQLLSAGENNRNVQSEAKEVPNEFARKYDIYKEINDANKQIQNIVQLEKQAKKISTVFVTDRNQVKWTGTEQKEQAKGYNDQSFPHQQLMKINQNQINISIIDSEHSLKHRQKNNENATNLPEIKNTCDIKKQEQLIKEIQDSLGKVQQVLQDEYETFNFMKGAPAATTTGGAKSQQQTNISSYSSMGPHQPPTGASSRLTQRGAGEVGSSQTSPSKKTISGQTRQMQLSQKTRQMQTRNDENKKILEQVIKELKTRGLVGVHQHATSNLCGLAPSLEIQGVSPKQALSLQFDVIHRNQILMNTGAAAHPGDLENTLSKRKYKLKTKNVLSQIDSIRKNQAIINKPNDAGDSGGLESKLQQNKLSSKPQIKTSCDAFNKWCQQFNCFLQLTMQKRAHPVPNITTQSEEKEIRIPNVLGSQSQLNSQMVSTLNLTPQKCKQINEIAKHLNFPPDFFKKNITELGAYLKSKDFLVLMRTKMHVAYNQLNIDQFRFHTKNPLIPEPQIFTRIRTLNAQNDAKNEAKEQAREQGREQQTKQLIMQPKQQNNNQPVQFKYYTDATGNNHPIVRQILKRRPWLVRLDKIKSPGAFHQVNFIWTQWRRGDISSKLSPVQIYGKIAGNFLLTNKANLFKTMSDYYEQVINQNIDDLMPITYSLITEPNMSQNFKFKQILDKYHNNKSKSIWICKPGQNANRGRGIRIFTCLLKIKKFLEQKAEENWVIQKYIERPILLGGVHWYNTPMRKFDIRMFGLAQIVDGIHFRGYFYKEGYIRTSSYPYNLQDLEDRDVHLTNDAVQDRNEEYGKYEQGNKMSQKDFANYIKCHRNVNFYKQIYPKIKEAIKNTLHAFWVKLFQRTCEYRAAPETASSDMGKDDLVPVVKNNQFELFGYDFMIDEQLKVYLIEVNTNPCLETSACPLLHRLISQVLDQTFKIAVDPFYQPGNNFNPQELKKIEAHYAASNEMSVSEFQYELVYSNYEELQEHAYLFRGNDTPAKIEDAAGEAMLRRSQVLEHQNVLAKVEEDGALDLDTELSQELSPAKSVEPGLESGTEKQNHQ